MTESSYGMMKTLSTRDFDEGRLQLIEALKGQGFGILSEIDVQAKMKEKLGAELRPYRILGACNPPLALQAFQAEPNVGLILPCNAVVYQAEDGAIVVGIARPEIMFQPIGRDDMQPLVEDASARLAKALAALV